MLSETQCRVLMAWIEALRRRGPASRKLAGEIEALLAAAA